MFLKITEDDRTLLDNKATTSYNQPTKRANPRPRLYEVDELNAIKAHMASLINALNQLSIRNAPSIAHMVACSTYLTLDNPDLEQANYVDRTNQFHGQYQIPQFLLLMLRGSRH